MMLQVTTEVVSPRKKERERRHFPHIHNVKSRPAESRPHTLLAQDYGTDTPRPQHGQHTESPPVQWGPDWWTELRDRGEQAIADGQASHTRSDNWPFPTLEERSSRATEGLHPLASPQPQHCADYVPQLGYADYYYRLSNGKKYFDWTLPQDTEPQLGLLFGDRGKRKSIYHMIERRNDLSEASPGDKSYQVPEYSPSFYKMGSTRPLAKYGPAPVFDAPSSVIPLSGLTKPLGPSFTQKEKAREVEQEVTEVHDLDNWEPAIPLRQTIPNIVKK